MKRTKVRARRRTVKAWLVLNPSFPKNEFLWVTAWRRLAQANAAGHPVTPCTITYSVPKEKL